MVWSTAVNKNLEAEKIRKAVCDKIVDEVSEELLSNTLTDQAWVRPGTRMR
jgi:hypothetical protein